jgi:L-threonylcarbamoyladenylate synthase
VSEIDPGAIRAAAKILRNGGLVAFATETVYGLGADATNPRAIQRIYQVKGRPPTNPLIVHVSNEPMAKKYTARWPAEAAALARVFWPGPLTLVVPRGPSIAPQVSAGLDTIGVRAPNHALAQSLLRAFDGPIAAPSANRSNRISPTTAEHVRGELGDAVDLILDGGACQVGIESTVVDVSGARPVILRPGSITAAQISEVIGNVEAPSWQAESSRSARSPGQQSVHYAPHTPAFRFPSEQANDVFRHLLEQSRSAAVVLLKSLFPSPGVPGAGESAVGSSRHRVVVMPRDAQQYAQRLYAILHELDAGGFTAIWIELPPDQPAWKAVRDRILRATSDHSLG